MSGQTASGQTASGQAASGQTASGHPWLADRTAAFDASGIRKVFDLAASLDDPINLSIGQPNFDVPPAVRDAAVAAIHDGKNAYSPTQGIAPLRSAMSRRIAEQYGHDDRELFISSGTSGGLTLAMLAMINPGDEVIYGDPYFVMYPALIRMCGGVPVPVDTAPHFKLTAESIRDAITPRTKMIVVNSPANPTGVTSSQSELDDIAALARDHEIALISDEIYSHFVYDHPFASPAASNDQTIVIDGFSKSHAMTGWRVGYVHGPSEIIASMMKIQQYSFVCSPQPAQWGAVAAMDVDLSHHIDDYRRKRNLICDALSPYYDIVRPGGAFYVYPKAPGKDGGEAFVHRAIEQGLLIIPGNVFSRHDTYFRISFAADDQTLHRGIEVLQTLATTP